MRNSWIKPQEDLYASKAAGLDESSDESPVENLDSIRVIIENMIADAICDTRVSSCFERLEQWVPDNYTQCLKQETSYSPLSPFTSTYPKAHGKLNPSLEGGKEPCATQTADALPGSVAQPGLLDFSEFVIRSALLGILEEFSNPLEN